MARAPDRRGRPEVTTPQAGRSVVPPTVIDTSTVAAAGDEPAEPLRALPRSRPGRGTGRYRRVARPQLSVSPETGTPVGRAAMSRDRALGDPLLAAAERPPGGAP